MLYAQMVVDAALDVCFTPQWKAIESLILTCGFCTAQVWGAELNLLGDM